MKKVFSILLLIVLVSSNLWAEGLILKYKGKEGDLLLYKLNTTVNTRLSIKDLTQKAQESITKTEMVISQAVSSVKDDVITFKNSIDSGTIIKNGRVAKFPGIKKAYIIKSKENGKILSVKGPPAKIDFENMQIVFPDRALKTGDQWEKELPKNNKQPVDLKVVYTFKGQKILGKHKCAVIKTVVKQVGKNIPKALQDKGIKGIDMNTKGTIYFDYDKGILVKSEVDSVTVISSKYSTSADRIYDLETKTKVKSSYELQDI